MKNQTIQPCLIILLVLLTSCQKGFQKTVFGKTTFNEEKIFVHDKKSFEIINKEFAKDNVRAYFRGKEIEGSHGASFKLLKNGYAIDNKTVYYVANYRDGTFYYTKKTSVIKQLKDENPEHFVVLKDNFAKGNKHAYWGHGKLLANSDGPSFEILGGGFAIDKNRAYYQFNEIYNSIGKSFRLLSHPYAVDEKSVFYKNIQIEGADKNTFKPLFGEIAKDDKAVYDRWKIVEGIDAISYEQIKDTNYATDKDNAYWQTEVISSAHRSSFWAKAGSSYARDKYNYYYKTEILKTSNELYPYAVKDYENSQPDDVKDK